MSLKKAERDLSDLNKPSEKSKSVLRVRDDFLEPIIGPDPLLTQKKDDRRGRSPHQPTQKTLDLKRSYEVISPNL